APALAAEAAAGGHEVLVHLPMEPDGAVADPGPNALLDGLGIAELQRRLVANLDGLTGYDGVNNHMGSGLTRDGPAMAVVMAELAKRGVFFVDSKTSAQTVAWREAERAGVPWSIRDVFLDDEPGIWAVEVQLQHLEAAARRGGFAVGIGHPYPSTLKALDVWLRGLSARGFELVPVARTLRHPSPAVAEAQ
ncbi:MAG: divergent polysaccharide deacetylase family protein, partial [Alphaproteobacteria bacterium]